MVNLNDDFYKIKYKNKYITIKNQYGGIIKTNGYRFIVHNENNDKLDISIK